MSLFNAVPCHDRNLCVVLTAQLHWTVRVVEQLIETKRFIQTTVISVPPRPTADLALKAQRLWLYGTEVRAAKDDGKA
jgi:hypothetical protein